jgi:hypothetical protein
MSALAPRAKYPTARFDQPGTVVAGTITEPPASRQARKYGTNEPEAWPSGDPVMETRVILRQKDGLVNAVYAKSRMARAITDAIVKAGATDLEVGGILVVEFTGYGEGKNPANPPKEYEASYVPPSDGESPF